MEGLGEWMLAHPKAVRLTGLALVAFSTWCYLGTLRKYVMICHLLDTAAADAARAASEALGG